MKLNQLLAAMAVTSMSSNFNAVEESYEDRRKRINYYHSTDDKYYTSYKHETNKQVITERKCPKCNCNRVIALFKAGKNCLICRNEKKEKKYAKQKEMNKIQEVEAKVRAQIEVATELDVPKDPKSTWFLNLVYGKYAAVVGWRPALGFGISSLHEGDADSSYGDSADELYESVDEVVLRLVELLTDSQKTKAPST